VPRFRSSSWRRKSSSSSGPLGISSDRPAGWRAIAVSAAVHVEYQLKSGPATALGRALAVTHDLVRHDLRAMSHANAPTTNVAAMM
jgi:predicted ATPase